MTPEEVTIDEIERLMENHGSACHQRLEAVEIYKRGDALMYTIRMVFAERDALRARVDAAEKLLRPLYECDPAIRVWFGDPAYGPMATEPEPEFGCQHNPMSPNCTLKHTGFQEGKTFCVWCRGVFYLPVATADAALHQRER